MNIIERRAFKRNQLKLLPGYIVILILLLIIVVPLLLIIIMSGSDWNEFNKDFLSILKTGFQWQNYSTAWDKGNMPLYFKNTFIVMLISLAMTNLFASLLAYAIKYYNSKISNLAYYVILSAMFIPAQALMLPLYTTMSKLHLLNNLFGVALVYTGMGLPLATMMYTGFYKGIDRGLLEAAMLDGCNSLQVYAKVMLPLSKTVASTVVILSGMTIWKDFFVPLIVVSDMRLKTVATSMQMFVSEYTTEWSSVCAAMVIQTIPAIIIFLLLQKQFVSGITAGSVKG